MPWAPKRHNWQQVEANREAVRQAYEKTPERREHQRFYNSAAWLKFRAWFLSVNPLCHRCLANGITRPATIVHHKTPRKTHPELAFDADNAEPICQSCHSREEALRRGGVGGSGPRAIPDHSRP
jgi:5-methylcytosine-specific restriction endonuclease McrA